MLIHNQKLIKILIAIILCSSSLELMAQSIDRFLNSSPIQVEQSALNIPSTQLHCDETRASTCSSSSFIALFASSSHFPKHTHQKQIKSYVKNFDSISLDVPIRPPRLI